MTREEIIFDTLTYLREKGGYIYIGNFLLKKGIDKKYHTQIKETLTKNGLVNAKVGERLVLDITDPKGISAIDNPDYFRGLDFSLMPQYMPYSIVNVIIGILHQIGTSVVNILKTDNCVSKIIIGLLIAITAAYFFRTIWF